MRLDRRQTRVVAFLVAAALGAVLLAGSAAAAGPTDGTTSATPVTTLNDAEDEVPLTCSNSTRNYSTVSEEGPYSLANANETVYSLSSDQDGEPIQIGLIRPNTSKDVPVIVKATPYVDDLRNDDISECVGIARLAHNFVQHGYAVAVIPVRGTGGSGGCMDLFGTAERRDLDQAVTHLGEAGWSNGNVAMTGGSYDGTTPWEVAAMGNPHLETIIPISGVPNVHQLMYRNGAPETRGPLILNSLYYGISLGTDSPVTGTKASTYATRAKCPDEYAQGEYASAYAALTGKKDPGGYWAERNLKPLVERNYEGSVFLVHGLQDWNVDPSQIYPWAEELEADEDIRMRYMLGQWGHAYPDSGSLEPGTRRSDWADIALKWFDQELKGKNVDVGPDAYVQDSTGEWRTASTWPTDRATEQSWYLRADGNLSRESADATATKTVAIDPDNHQSIYYPGDVPGCATCAQFETARFDEQYRFAGEPDLNVTVTPTGPGGYLTAYLYAVDENGTATRVGWGMVDLRYADRGTTPDRVVPGQKLDVSIPIEPLDVKIPAGSKLRVVLHQGTMSGRVGGTPPYPVLVHVGGGSATLDVSHFEATAQPSAAPGSGADTPPVSGSASTEASATRSDDGELFTAGQTNQVDVNVSASQPIRVRDTIPASWNVTGGDVVRVETSGDVKHVYLGTVHGTLNATYFAEAPSGPAATGRHTFGPVEVRAGGSWTALSGTSDTNLVVGISTRS